MISTLLQTRIRVPPLHTALFVPRPRLSRAIERGVPDHKLILLSAPAGFGKTTLLSDWVRTTRFPVAWVSLDGADDLERFMRYLVAAWELVHPGVSEGALGLLASSASPDRSALLTEFINAGVQLSDNIVFVLDDYHDVDDPAIHEAVSVLIDHFPPTMHIVLSCRGEPPVPLARLRARQELFELREDDLHFSIDETESLLNDTMGLALAPSLIESLHHQLEGWAAGLHLVALAGRGGWNSDIPLAVTGRQRYIADYLAGDVLRYLSADARLFLLQTSILGELCGDLCDAVTGRTDGREMLEYLDREDLFLVPLDDRREWYRYHRVFAAFLEEELRRRHQDAVVDLHERAARWYLSRDMPEPAFHHALESRNIPAVIDVIERHAYAKILSGEVRVVQRWFDALPAHLLETSSLLAIYRSFLLIASGSFEACHRHLDDLEHRLAREEESDDRRARRAYLTAFRCFLACFQNDLPAAERYAAEALRDLPEQDLNFRPGIFGALGDTYRRNSRWDDAYAWYVRILDYSDLPSVKVHSAHLYGALADLSLRQGHLRDAASFWRQAIAIVEDPGNAGRFELPFMGWMYVRLGELLYEWNLPTDAWDLITRGRRRADAGGDVQTLIAANLAAGRLKLTEGDRDAVSGFLQQTRHLIESASFPDWSDRFERFQVEVWLATHQLEMAVNWAERVLGDDATQGVPVRDLVHVAAARVLIAKGDQASLTRALEVLDRVSRQATAEGRTGLRIEVLALKALACRQGNDPSGALVALEDALRLAEPEGYVRLFADLGLPMVRLLQQALARGVMPDYVATLLDAASTGGELPHTGRPVVPEPLTSRELDVLRLMAAGLTNAEIGARLFISPQTVKKHTGNIYAKLGARNRTEAVARARAIQDLHG